MSKTDEAYQFIKKEIIGGNLNNKAPLSVNILASKLGMSKTPVRDALQKLQSEGFIRIIPNQGIVIQELTILEATHMYELRIAIEEYLLKQIIPMLKEENITYLRNLLDKQKQAMENNDPYEFMKHDSEQHLYLHKIYFNPIIHDVVNQLVDRIFYGGVQALRLPGRMEATLNEHTILVDAIEERDLDKAIRALEYHFTKGLSSTTISLERFLQN